jgi:SAM-dependent methyltransferase
MSHGELVARTLRITPDTWRAVLEEYRASVPLPIGTETPDDEIRRCLGALGPIYRRHDPRDVPLPASVPGAVCPACRQSGAEAAVGISARLLYGRCPGCGHGIRLGDGAAWSESEVRRRHAGADYFRQRDDEGAGYDGYDRDAAYREAKGARLVERLRELPPPEIRTLLEVGSGYGYTRVAAERAGIRTGGVDLNGEACREAAGRYGLRTFQGTLAEALASDPPVSPHVDPGFDPGAWDAVLYQFVLEHVVDPARELTVARQALRAEGWLVLSVPSMDAAEIEVFGAAYRSFRGDHLHLFTRASLGAILAAAGFRLHLVESGCNIHLFGDVLSPPALAWLYESGRGPDLFAVARRLA